MVSPVASFCVFAGLSVNLGMYVRRLHPYVCTSTYTRVHTPSSVQDSVCATHTHICAWVYMCMLCRSFTFYVCKSIHILGAVWSRMVFSTPGLYYKSICGLFPDFLPSHFSCLKLCPCGFVLVEGESRDSGLP